MRARPLVIGGLIGAVVGALLELWLRIHLFPWTDAAAVVLWLVILRDLDSRSAPAPPVSRVMVARKRWGRGRTRQLVAGVWCWAFGHRWGAPYYDNGTVLHRCERGCGGLHVGVHFRGPHRRV